MTQSGITSESATAPDSMKKPARKSHSFSGGSSPLGGASNAAINRSSPHNDRPHTEERTNSTYQGKSYVQRVEIDRLEFQQVTDKISFFVQPLSTAMHSACYKLISYVIMQSA